MSKGNYAMLQTTPEPLYADLHAIRPAQLTPSSPVPGLRETVFLSRRTGAGHLWMARVTCAPDRVSPVHHHGESEAGFYVLSGSLTFFFGEGLRQWVDLYQGDSIFIPAWTLHAEGNLGSDESDVIAIRSTATPIAFYLPDIRVPEEVVRNRSQRPAERPAV
jgi:uncharacterized RmlC-like cupin family protein